VLAHDLIEGVGVVTGHEEVDHAWARPPLAVFAVLREEQTCRERDCDRLAGARAFKT
jgi:hypothetical protein